MREWARRAGNRDVDEDGMSGEMIFLHEEEVSQETAMISGFNKWNPISLYLYWSDITWIDLNLHFFKSLRINNIITSFSIILSL